MKFQFTFRCLRLEIVERESHDYRCRYSCILKFCWSQFQRKAKLMYLHYVSCDLWRRWQRLSEWKAQTKAPNIETENTEKTCRGNNYASFTFYVVFFFSSLVQCRSTKVHCKRWNRDMTSVILENFYRHWLTGN